MSDYQNPPLIEAIVEAKFESSFTISDLNKHIFKISNQILDNPEIQINTAINTDIQINEHQQLVLTTKQIGFHFVISNELQISIRHNRLYLKLTPENYKGEKLRNSINTMIKSFAGEEFKVNQISIRILDLFNIPANESKFDYIEQNKIPKEDNISFEVSDFPYDENDKKRSFITNIAISKSYDPAVKLSLELEKDYSDIKESHIKFFKSIITPKSSTLFSENEK